MQNQMTKNLLRTFLPLKFTRRGQKLPRLFSFGAEILILGAGIMLYTYSISAKVMIPDQSIQMPDLKTEILKDQRGDIRLSRPQAWDYLHGAFGMTHIYAIHPARAGSELNSASGLLKRTSVSVTVTGIDNLQLDDKAVAKEYESYKAGRTRWAQRMGAKILNFGPHQKTFNNFKYPIYKASVAYEYNKIRYQEISYHVLCQGKNKNMIHLKALSRDSAEHVTPIIDHMAHDLECLSSKTISTKQAQNMRVPGPERATSSSSDGEPENF